MARISADIYSTVSIYIYDLYDQTGYSLTDASLKGSRVDNFKRQCHEILVEIRP
jgi:hypothetical protein